MRKIFHVIFLLLLLPFSTPAAHASSGDWLVRGRNLFMRQHYIESLDCFTRAMNAAWQERDLLTYFQAIGSIGSVYNNFGDYPRAMYYYNKVIEAHAQYGLDGIYTSALESMVACCCNAGDLAAARRYYALQQRAPRSDNDLVHYYLLTNGGLIASAEGNPRRAMDLFRRALAFTHEKKMDKVYTAALLNEMANAYMALKCDDSALVYLKRCESLSLKGELDGYLSEVYFTLVKIYGRQGKTAEADTCRKKYARLLDKTFSEQRLTKASNRLLESQGRISDSQIGELSTKVSRQTWTIILFATLILVLLVMLVVIIRQARRQRQAYRLLIDKDRELAVKPTVLAGPQATGNLSQQQVDELLQRINRVMENTDRIFSPDFSMATLCREVGSNTKYVSMVINATYNKNFKTLLNERRVREAARQLSAPGPHNSATIQQLALSLGYSSSTSFIIAFKKVMGMTPTVYRRLANERKEHVG